MSERTVYFNEYALSNGKGWIVALGPITDFVPITTVDTQKNARGIVNALRAVVGQPQLSAIE